MNVEEVAPRSPNGCLTCKKRKKKCDEARPACRRCTEADIQCLGYQSTILQVVPQGNTTSAQQPIVVTHSDAPLRLSSELGEQRQHAEWQTVALRRQPMRYRPIVPHPVVINDVFSFVVSRQTQFASRAVFRPTQVSVPAAVLHEASGPRLKLWALYIGAKIAQAISDGRNEDCGALIERFHGCIRDASGMGFSSAEELAVKLSCLIYLVHSASMGINSQAAYGLLNQTLPTFIHLASKYPQLWSHGGTILIDRALCHSPHYAICAFVFYDTLTALAFARSPLALYETQSASAHGQGHDFSRQIEQVYGCTAPMVILVSKINAWRAGARTVSNRDWRGLEKDIINWPLLADYTDDSIGRIMHLAVQESWRNALLIYLYMGLCRANSADPKVEAAVQQVVDLVGIVSTGNVLENHLFIPCLIASVAAREELHRQVLRRKLVASTSASVWFLRGADFVHVLDTLWHGAGRDGRGILWDEYVRCKNKQSG